VQSAQLGDHLVPGAEMEVVRVAEQDLRAGGADLVRVERLDGRLRPDGHERGRRDLAVRGFEDAGPGLSVGRRDPEAHRISMASPKE
jgi:hypothetical protein